MAVRNIFLGILAALSWLNIHTVMGAGNPNKQHIPHSPAKTRYTMTVVSTSTVKDITTVKETTTVTAVSTMTALSTLTKLSTITATVTDPICKVVPFLSLGCWVENSTPGRMLIDDFLEDSDNMSIWKCAHYCSKYALFGLEYGSQCFCGNEVNKNTAFRFELEECNWPCPGNSSEFCGGAGTLFLWTSLEPPPSLPPPLQNNITYSPAGCWQEPGDGSRALSSYVYSSLNMNIESCAYLCGMSNYLYSGLQWSVECWCGNSVSSKAVQIADNQCTMTCSGNSSQTCGDSSIFNLYNGTINSGTAEDLTLRDESLIPRLGATPAALATAKSPGYKVD